MQRRDFLKSISAAAAVPAVMSTVGRDAAAETSPRFAAAALPDIPTCESMRSVTMTHKFLDLYAWPGLTNQWGCAQASMDVTAIRSIAFPPFAQGEMNVAPLGAGGELLTGVLYVDGEYFTATKTPIEFVWRPDRIERRSVYKGLELKSTTIVPFKTMSVAVKLTVSNTTKARRKTEIKLAVNGGVTKSVKPWNAAYSPGEYDNERTIDNARNAILCKSKHTEAFVLQGSSPKPDKIEPSWIVYKLDLAPGQSASIAFVNSVGGNAADAQKDFDGIIDSFDTVAKATTDEWDRQLRAAFTPGNDVFSGHVPTLVTTDDNVKRIYHSAVMSALYFRRTSPHSVYGTTYVTLMPRYWETTTFLWDISLSAMLLSMLDPAILKRMMETWMTLDIYKHFGTEFLTGAGVGPWYSVNDYAMSRMAKEYLRWTGDRAWLDKVVNGKTVYETLLSYAEHWRALDVNGHGLADYGGVTNLLEAVSSYVHEVAGLNAANVHNLRFAAELAAYKGDRAKAEGYRDEAVDLGRRVQDLYVPGRGIWKCKLPDGSYNEVHHCYDFGVTLMTIGDMMPATQKREMVDFFVRELKTPTWMRALSTRDLDVTFSIRPDHQWTGAYCSWPALALSGLFAAGAVDLANDWIKGLAKTSMQGPYAQAHFTESFYTPESNGAASKSPSDQPYINDWACVSGCNYLEPIVDSLFGVNAGLFDGITAKPQFGKFDPKAELRNINYQGKRHTAGKNGIRPE
ncbi:MAG: hypothetical protein IT174_13575 [Acidobacteria bacterium]|nr:hypothetical protein [Acidobacteriota bacterium]